MPASSRPLHRLALLVLPEDCFTREIVALLRASMPRALTEAAGGEMIAASVDIS